MSQRTCLVVIENRFDGCKDMYPLRAHWSQKGNAIWRIGDDNRIQESLQSMNDTALWLSDAFNSSKGPGADDRKSKGLLTTDRYVEHTFNKCSCTHKALAEHRKCHLSTSGKSTACREVACK